MTCCFTPQEKRIMDKNNGDLGFREGRERVYKILDRFQGKKPVVDIERAVYFTESMKQTEGKILVLRWALAMKNVAEKMTVYIDEDNLLAGRGGKAARYGIMYPELCGNVIEQTLDSISGREGSAFDVLEEDREVLRRDIAPYWKDKAFFDDFVRSLPEETLRISYDPQNPTQVRNIVNETMTLRGSLQWVPDYEKAISKGFKAIKEEAQEKLNQMNQMEYDVYGEKRQFLEAVVIECDAIILWAHRHAEEALRLAEQTENTITKQELLDIAERCKQVPEYPARNFAEAVQAHWFTALFHRLEISTGSVVSNGRMDQFLYPYYKQDIQNGTLTEKEATELLECLWVTMAQSMDLKFAAAAGTMLDGYAHWEAVTIGGQTCTGQDATNELTYLMLKSKQEFTLDYPDLSARVHKRSPEKYLREIVKTIKEGSGYPKLFNDEEIILNLVSKGAPLEDAFNYAASGCSEVRMPNRETFTCGDSYVSLVAPLELVLYNGKTFATGEEIVGLKTGELTQFPTWDAFWDAYTDQLNNLFRHMLVHTYWGIELRDKHYASPLSSCLHDLCMDSCKDLHSKKIPGGIDIGFFDVIGYATATDSLAAIKKLVYDEKIYSLEEIVSALKTNFEGNEIMRQRMLHAPKYGNNDAYADDIARKIENLCTEYARKASDFLEIHLDARMVPITAHVAFGHSTGATPDGRKASVTLSDGASAAQGADINGPTAVLMSNHNTKDYRYKERAARLLNLKFTPSSLEGDTGICGMVNFIRAWCDLGLWFVQFNVINPETLKAAQSEPEKYRNLIVRVAGYSAYFTALSKGVQDDIISRTQHNIIR